MTTTLNPPWWQDYADMLPGPFLDAIAVENDATRICTYETSLVPGLLQTPEYARMVMTAAGAAPDLVERGARLRLARQQILSPDRATPLDAIIDEAAIVRAAQTDTGQLAALLTWTRRPYITVRVVPFTAGPVIPGQAPFTVLHTAAGGVLAYAKSPRGAVLSDATAAGWDVLFDRLEAVAASPEESAGIIRAAARAAQG
jgi:hypothetical protein